MRSYNPDEPARRRIYQKLYVRIGVQDDCISWLLIELRALQKRMTQLEKRNDNLTAAAVRLAHSNAEESREPEPCV